MNKLLLIRKHFNFFLFSRMQKANLNEHIIKTPFQAILDVINLSELKKLNLNSIKYNIINYLNHNQIDYFLDSIHDDNKRDLIEKIIRQERFRWYNQIESEIVNNIEEARLSLNTSDYIAFIIRKKVKLQENKTSNFFKSIYSKIDHDLNIRIISPVTINYFETDQKSNVPVSQALSFFFNLKKKDALIKFNRLLSNDRESRLDESFQAEYFETTRLFFERLNLDFIPLIDFKNQYNPISLTNENNDFITKEEIQLIIDNEDYFNKREFDIEVKKLLKKKNIINEEKLRYSYFEFFKAIDKDKEVNWEHINILISCFTQKNQDYDEYQIRNARVILSDLLNQGNNSSNFIILNYYLDINNVIKDSRNNLTFLLDAFFNKVKGMRNDTIKNTFYGRKIVDFNNAFPAELKNYIKNS